MASFCFTATVCRLWSAVKDNVFFFTAAVEPDLPRTLKLLQQGIEEGLHIGAQVYVSIEGEPVADIAIGEAQRGVAMELDTLMIWLSSTKPVAAVALARLREQGQLDFDDPVTLYIPEFGQNGKEAVTLQHVLTHTGGFRSVEVDWDWDPWDKIITSICEAPLEPGWIPGKKAGYHIASGWFVLAEILKRIDGRPFERLVREEIFEPIGMMDSWVGLPVERYRKYGSRIGIMQNSEKRAPEPHTHLDTEEAAAHCKPGGGGRGPIRELGRFYELLLAGGELNGVRILSAESVHLLTKPHRVGMFDETFRHRIDWGLGFILNSNRYGAQTLPYGYGLHASQGTFGHGGYQSSAGFADPEHGLVVALVFNGTPGEPRHNRRARTVHSAIYEDLGLAHPGK